MAEEKQKPVKIHEYVYQSDIDGERLRFEIFKVDASSFFLVFDHFRNNAHRKSLRFQFQDRSVPGQDEMRVLS